MRVDLEIDSSKPRTSMLDDRRWTNSRALSMQLLYLYAP